MKESLREHTNTQKSKETKGGGIEKQVKDYLRSLPMNKNLPEEKLNILANEVVLHLKQRKADKKAFQEEYNIVLKKELIKSSFKVLHMALDGCKSSLIQLNNLKGEKGFFVSLTSS